MQHSYLNSYFHFLQAPALKVIFPFVLGLLLGYTFPYALLYALSSFPLTILFVWSYFGTLESNRSKLLTYLSVGIFLLGGAFYSSWDYNRLAEVYLPIERKVRWVVQKTPRQTRSGLRIKAKRLQGESSNTFSEMLYVTHPPQKLSVGDTLYADYVTLKPTGHLQRRSYKSYLIAQRCSAVGYVDTLISTPRDKAQSITMLAVDVQNRLLKQMNNLPLSPLQKEMLGAMCLGYKAESIEAESLFKKAGVIHILSVSGFHLGVVCLFLGFLCVPLRRLSKGLYISILIQIIATWLFVGLTGFSAPAVRAAVMLALYQLSFLLKRPSNVINILSFSALLLLLLKPSYILDIGFQLSYAAVLSISLFYPLFIRSVPSASNLLLRYLYQSISLCLSAQLLTIPLTLYHFGELSLLSLWSNIPLVFLSTLLIPLGLIYMIFSSWSLSSWLISKGVEILAGAMESVLVLLTPIEAMHLKGGISLLQCLGLYIIISTIYISWSYWLHRKNSNVL